MSSSKWLAAAALMALAVPAAQAHERTRVQVTIAPYWGWDGPVRPVHGPYRRDWHRDDYYRDRRYGDYWGFSYGGPLLRFDYRSGGGYYHRPRGYYRPGGYYRYDSRRDRHYGRDRDWRDGRRDWRDHDRRRW